MADIAILVAEEYERRVKMSRKNGQEIELLSCMGILRQNSGGPLPSSSSSSSWMKGKVVSMEKMMEVLGEPKSQMSLAATNGFFSA